MPPKLHRNAAKKATKKTAPPKVIHVEVPAPPPLTRDQDAAGQLLSNLASRMFGTVVHSERMYATETQQAARPMSQLAEASVDLAVLIVNKAYQKVLGTKTPGPPAAPEIPDTY